MTILEGAREAVVHDAVGPPLARVQAAACLAVGVNALLALGVLPALLGALADEHRLTTSQIGLAAMVELLSMGVSTAVMALTRRPRGLRWIGLGTAVALAGADLLALGASGPALLALRGFAGAIEGVLLWITISMIARTQTPERWAGVFFTGQVLAQLLLALAFAGFVIARGGANGGLIALAVCAAAGVVPALFLPARFAPLIADQGVSGAPPPRGVMALIATFVFVSGIGAVAVFLQPLAHQAHLSSNVARTALWVSLVAQVAGGLAATAMAGRVRYFAVFVFVGAIFLAVWVVFALAAPAWLFVAANGAGGFAGLLLGPFLVPFTIDADPAAGPLSRAGRPSCSALPSGPCCPLSW